MSTSQHDDDELVLHHPSTSPDRNFSPNDAIGATQTPIMKQASSSSISDNGQNVMKVKNPKDPPTPPPSSSNLAREPNRLSSGSIGLNEATILDLTRRSTTLASSEEQGEPAELVDEVLEEFHDDYEDIEEGEQHEHVMTSNHTDINPAESTRPKIFSRLRNVISNSAARSSIVSNRSSVRSNSIVLNDSTILDLTRYSITSINANLLDGSSEMFQDEPDDDEADAAAKRKINDEKNKAVAMRGSQDPPLEEAKDSEPTDGSRVVDAALVMERNGLRTISTLSPGEVEFILSIRACLRSTEPEARRQEKARVIQQAENLLSSRESRIEEKGEEQNHSGLLDSLSMIVEENADDEIKKPYYHELEEKDEATRKKAKGGLEQSNQVANSARDVQSRGQATRRQRQQQQRSRRTVEPGAHAVRGIDYANDNDAISLLTGVEYNQHDGIETEQTRMTNGESGSLLDRNESADGAPIVASLVQKTTEAEVLSPEEMEELAKPALRRRRNFLRCAGAFAIIAIVVGIVVPLTTQPKDTVTTLAPSSAPTTSPTLTFDSRVQFLQDIIINKTVPPDSNTTRLMMPNTPEHKAFEWLSQEEPMLMDENRILQRYVLALLYFSNSGEVWSRINFFLDPGNECDWMMTGINCNENGVISELDLSNNKMTGSLPHELFALTKLIRLNLSGNKLEGQLPSIGLRKLTLLKEFDVSSNRLVGTIPSEVESLSSMEILSMASNRIAGTLPAGITGLTGLHSINFAVNSLTGTIPIELYNMTQLISLRLRSNSWSGTLPTEIGHLTLLTDLELTESPFTGTIPSEIGALTQLTRMQINTMKLSGTIPPDLGQLTQLSKLALSINQITGTLPDTFSNLTALRELYLQGTHLSGNVSFFCQKFGPRLRAFRVDLEEVACDCCKCCY